MHFDTHVWEFDFQSPMKVIYLLFISFKYVENLILFNIVLNILIYMQPLGEDFGDFFEADRDIHFDTLW